MSWWNPFSWFSQKPKSPHLYESRRGGYPVHIVDDYHSDSDGLVWDVLIDDVWVLYSSITDPRLRKQIDGIDDDAGTVASVGDPGEVDEDEGEPCEPDIGWLPVPPLYDDDATVVEAVVAAAVDLADTVTSIGPSEDPQPDPTPDPEPIQSSFDKNSGADDQPSTPNYTGCSGGSCWSSSNAPIVSTDGGDASGDITAYASSTASSNYDEPATPPTYDTTPGTDGSSYVEPAPAYSPDPDPTPSYTPDPDPDPTPSYDPPADTSCGCDSGSCDSGSTDS